MCIRDRFRLAIRGGANGDPLFRGHPLVHPAVGGGVYPASYSRMNQWMTAEERVAVRAAPDRQSERLATLREGQTFQAVGRVRGSNWIVVADHGRIVGYVPGDVVEPASYDQYAYLDD